MSKMIKVAHVVNRFATGGAEKVLIHLCNSKTAEIKNLICSLQPPCTNFQRYINSKKRDIRYVAKKKGNDWSVIKRIRDIIKQENIDIVHAQGWGTYIEALLATKFFFSSKPFLIFAFRGKTTADLEKGIPFRRKIASKFAFYLTDKIITPSREMALDYAGMIGIPHNKIEIIPNGVDTNLFLMDYPHARQRLGLNKDDFVVGFVGRLDAVKDTGGLIEVFLQFSKNIGKLDQRPVLLVIGDGPERNMLQKQAESSGLKEHVLMPGIRSDIPACMSAMDVYFQPSLYEGLSNTILEAMASRLPVVTTRVGGTPEIIEHGVNGLLFEPRDYKNMANALLTLYNNREFAQKLGRCARKTVFSCYSAEAMVKNYEALYQKLLLKKAKRIF